MTRKRGARDDSLAIASPSLAIASPSPDDGVPFELDRKLRHLNRKQQPELEAVKTTSSRSDAASTPSLRLGPLPPTLFLPVRPEVTTF
ncbi:hypothetical protein KFK09_008625 [Dendrobium nobile]|uniref:Uncharacterized protein n=1 Tax=Dendrobium nobile TaxID=94219 RepID=A0A8T3BKL4_DENNO|nr:hypothetical protein KFK09_008625 [Dendrobium nobile]